MDVVLFGIGAMIASLRALARGSVLIVKNPDPNPARTRRCPSAVALYLLQWD